MSVITESERKRLQSLKEKKHAFKIKGQLIHQALSDLNNAKSNKIRFDDDFGEEQSTKPKRQKIALFDSDDDNDDNKKDVLWNEDEFAAKKKKKVVLGNDARFTLDDRFMEDDHSVQETEVKTGTDECDLQKEKEKQLDILESILGMPLVAKSQENSNTKSTKQELMVRYDPTENEHCKYEVKTVQSEKSEEKSSKKKKREKPMPEVEEPAPVDVSKDIYYAVSDTLAESLKQKEEFSLLKTFGKEKKNDTGHAESNDASIAESKDRKFRFNFNASNVLNNKCDSSDEDVDEVNKPDANERTVEGTEYDENTCNIFAHKDILFFDKDDVRFNEAVRFFNAEAAPTDEFKNLRRELKQIVRTKIRNNEKQHQRWGKKRKIKKFSR
ncbi:hypothetical protein DMN91_004913 [Ooceraea biroi]|uniref:Putative RNA-binding protein n=1 Tax=Ooceraea biroi TaxID=2015173 RepID=A0A026VYP2_OOCBI|nr:nucleolar protein 8 [Ooceraea biroi]EZA48780.1 putative RNA-binding protein [Ooceraea biroi]RLU22635.1 hypothetical protein DMN91_004913 [Ooceraea biroi]